MKLSILLPLFLILINNSNSYIFYQGNNTPVIGIYTQPSRWDGYDNWDYDYIVSSYVRWLDQHGARIVPVPFSADEATLKKIFS
jgi:gamma-glutamyl hydrolase